jgi:RNA polymerase sigma-70 factor (ECF subfamily)
MVIDGDGQSALASPCLADQQPAAGRFTGLGGELEFFRNYLILVAQRDLAPDLAAKVGASDLVQDTFLAAGRDIAQLRGRSPSELRAWLEGILQHLLANTRRRYRGTQKRRLDREVSGGRGANEAYGDMLNRISLSTTSPSSRAMRHEREAALCAAIRTLPEHYRQVIEWHHQEQLAFETIAARMGSSPDAARKVWARALLRLRKVLGPGHDAL